MKPHSKITRLFALFFFLLVGVSTPLNLFASNIVNVPSNKSFKLEINNIFLILNEWNSKLNKRETLHANVKLSWNICNPNVFIEKYLIFHEKITKERIELVVIDTLRTYAAKSKDISDTESIYKMLENTMATLGVCVKNFEIKRITRQSRRTLKSGAPHAHLNASYFNRYV